MQYSNSEIINEICNNAEKESKLSKSVQELRSKWEANVLLLERCPSQAYQFALVDPNSFLRVKKEGQKTARFALSPSSQLAADQECVQLITNADEFCVELEEDITSLQVFLGSVSSGSGISSTIKKWLVMLRQIMEITGLMSTGQTEVCMHPSSYRVIIVVGIAEKLSNLISSC